VSIEDRNLAVGTRLIANYKKARYVCTVEAAESGEGVVYALEGGKRHKSPSSAGMEVMGGKAANGWRFWSVAGEGGRVAPPPATERESRRKPTTAKPKLQIKKLPNQKGVPDGQVRWFCSACMKSFLMPLGQEPATCPEGHPWAVQDEQAVE